MKKFFFDCGTRDATASMGLLVLRIGIGIMMLLGHGLPKLQKYDVLAGGKWRSPDIWPFSMLDPKVSLICALGGEIVASALLILGLMTRPAAFAFGFVMVVAAFYTHGQDTWFMRPDGGSKEPALLYLLPAIVLILTGAGSWSMDSVIYRGGKKKRW